MWFPYKTVKLVTKGPSKYKPKTVTDPGLGTWFPIHGALVLKSDNLVNNIHSPSEYNKNLYSNRILPASDFCLRNKGFIIP